MLEQQHTIRAREGDWQPRPTLAGSDYTSPEVWEEERERIWFGDWVCIGRAEEVANPGDYLVRELAGESIFVIRNQQGELHGFYNVCSHRGTKFLDDEPATGNVRKAFVCPYHSWTYDLNGCLIGTPNVKENEHFDRGRYPLHGFPVDTYAGFLFATLAREPRPLVESLRGVESVMSFDRFRMDELRVGVRIVYEVAANWKIVVENYNECLHCPVIHPELVQVVPLFRFGEVWDGMTRDGGNDMVEGAKSFTMTGLSSLISHPSPRPVPLSLSLPLLVPWVRTNHIHRPLPPDDFAVLANPLHARPHLHRSSLTFPCRPARLRMPALNSRLSTLNFPTSPDTRSVPCSDHTATSRSSPGPRAECE